MEQSIKEKITKIYELVNHGATEGERAAAKKALDRMMSKYSLDLNELDTIKEKEYCWRIFMNYILVISQSMACH